MSYSACQIGPVVSYRFQLCKSTSPRHAREQAIQTGACASALALTQQGVEASVQMERPQCHQEARLPRSARQTLTTA
jgi:hypothetical protein